MKGMRIAIVAAIFATWPAVYAQNMVEYSTLAAKPTTLPNAIAATSHAVTKKAGTLEANLKGDTGSSCLQMGGLQQTTSSLDRTRLRQRSSSYPTAIAWNAATIC